MLEKPDSWTDSNIKQDTYTDSDMGQDTHTESDIGGIATRTPTWNRIATRSPTWNGHFNRKSVKMAILTDFFAPHRSQFHTIFLARNV